MRPVRSRRMLLSAAILAAALAGCGGGGSVSQDGGERQRRTAAERPVEARSGEREVDVYAHTRAGMLTAATRNVPYRIYVPNGESDTVDVVDPKREKVVRSFPVGGLPQHVTPSPDLRTLYVNSNQGNTLQRVDPRTGRPVGDPIPVEDPYNLYFTLDGKTGIVMAERLQRLDFRDAKTMKLEKSVTVPCPGLNHADFSPDGSYFVASCEFGSALIKVDTKRRKLLDKLTLPRTGMPQDVRISPDGRTFYSADMQSHGLWVINGERFRLKRFIPTGMGAHGLYPSRDARSLYVANRGEGSVSVLDFATGSKKDKWRIPGGGSPDMGGVSADGTELWLSGRYNSEIYGFDTRTGRLKARIPVGNGPHGMAVWPQPGRLSLGHTGNAR
jgi:YVTN family beta-propeller protein